VVVVVKGFCVEESLPAPVGDGRELYAEELGDFAWWHKAALEEPLSASGESVSARDMANGQSGERQAGSRPVVFPVEYFGGLPAGMVIEQLVDARDGLGGCTVLFDRG